MSTIRFTTLIAKATDAGSSPYALGAVFVSPEGDAVATDGKIMAVVQAEHSDGETVDDGGMRRPIPATASVLVPAKLGPSKAADTRAVFSVNGDASKTDHKGAKTSVPLQDGRFPRCGDVLPTLGECRELTIRPAQLMALMHALNASDCEGDDIITLLLPTDPDKAIGVLSGTFAETQGIGIVKPFAKEGDKADKYRARVDVIRARLNAAVAQFHKASSSPANRP